MRFELLLPLVAYASANGEHAHAHKHSHARRSACANRHSLGASASVSGAAVQAAALSSGSSSGSSQFSSSHTSANNLSPSSSTGAIHAAAVSSSFSTHPSGAAATSSSSVGALGQLASALGADVSSSASSTSSGLAIFDKAKPFTGAAIASPLDGKSLPQSSASSSSSGGVAVSAAAATGGVYKGSLTANHPVAGTTSALGVGDPAIWGAWPIETAAKSGLNESYSGIITTYDDGTTACGGNTYAQNGRYVIAVSCWIFSQTGHLDAAQGQGSMFCGALVTATVNGKDYPCVIQDSCEICSFTPWGRIDASHDLAVQMGLTSGHFSVDWKFEDAALGAAYSSYAAAHPTPTFDPAIGCIRPTPNWNIPA